MIDKASLDGVLNEADEAQSRYGDFASTHEALGVLTEEWDELRAAIHANDMAAIAREACQLSSVALRLFDHAREPSPAFRKRSGCE